MIMEMIHAVENYNQDLVFDLTGAENVENVPMPTVANDSEVLIKIHNGSTWVDGVPYIHNGSAWVKAKAVYVHNGSSWVQV